MVAAIAATGGRAVAIQADVSKPADVARMFASQNDLRHTGRTREQCRGLQSLPLEALMTEFHREFNTNVLGPMMMIESVRHFGPRSGSVSTSARRRPRCALRTTRCMRPPRALDAVTRVLAKAG